MKNLFLLAASLLFYAWGEPAFVPVMLASILINYVAALAIDSRRGRRETKWLLVLAVVANLAVLAYYKYANFAFENLSLLLTSMGLDGLKFRLIVLPLGISFFTFQALSYVVDVYRGDGKVQKNPINVALYIALFPQLIAGPIVRYTDVAVQIVQRTVTRAGFSEGIRRFIFGLGKKILIANRVGATADAIFASPAGELSAAAAWLGVVCYTLQIYFDFSGYSDMAIGLGHMFGFRFLENFNYPYVARSITEFWRRWHISLSSWYRDYLYVPLGGNRVVTWRVYLNLIIVFMLCGLWHGASWNFVVWGLYHGTFLVVERRFRVHEWLSQLGKPIGHAYVLLAVMISWVLFRAESLGVAIAYLTAMLGLNSAASDVDWQSHVYPGLIAAIVVGCIGSIPTMPWIKQTLDKLRGPGLRAPLNASTSFVAVAFFGLVLLASVVTLSAATYNPFIYYRF